MGYLENILEKYKPRNLGIYDDQLEHLFNVLKKWANTCYINIVESGSRAKGTAISLSSDVDYMISLTSNCNESKGGLKSIFESLYNELNRKYNNVRKQNVSIGIQIGELKIDITPARKYSGNTNYHSLYLSKRDSWTKTNIQKHINDIKNSGRTNEIKLLKIWRELNKLDFTSIYLEYLVLDVLKYKTSDNLENNFLYILDELSKNNNNPLFKRIVDPSNTNNVLSDLLTYNEKLLVIQTARKSINQQYLEDIIW